MLARAVPQGTIQNYPIEKPPARMGHARAAQQSRAQSVEEIVLSRNQGIKAWVVQCLPSVFAIQSLALRDCDAARQLPDR